MHVHIVGSDLMTARPCNQGGQPKTKRGFHKPNCFKTDLKPGLKVVEGLRFIFSSIS